MKKRNILATLFAVVLAMAAVVGLTSCTTTTSTPTAATYYLTGESTSWKTYDNAEDVPSAVKFTQGSDETSYTLTVSLAAADVIQIRDAASGAVIGYSSLMTTRQELTKGTDDKIVVGKAGRYAFTLYVTDGICSVTYTYTDTSTHDPTPSDKTATYVSISDYVETLAKGDTHTFTATVGYSDDSVDEEGKGVVWSSSDESVATVGAATGVVTAVNGGTATITATYGEDITDEVELTVVDSIPVTGVSLDETQVTLEKGEVKPLIATIEPTNATNKNVLWGSSNELVASVDSTGKVTAVGPGEATITVTTVDGGKPATCTVKVVSHVTGISVKETLKINNGGTGTITVSVTPNDASNKGYTYEIAEGNDIITVADDGNGTLTVTGVAIGNATIVVKSAENDTITDSCAVEVLEEGAVVVSLDETAKITKNGTTELTLSVTNATVSEVTWSSSKTEIATVSGSGETATVTGVDYGMTVITATISVDGVEYSDTCSVLVGDSFYYLVGSRWLNSSNKWAIYDTAADAEAAGVLLIEKSRGVYSITLDLTTSDSFHICSDQGWSGEFKAGGYYSSADSTEYAKLVSNDDNIGVDYNGNYTVTFDFTKGKPVMKVTMNSIEVTGIDIVYAGEYTLNEGDTATLTATAQPTQTTYTEYTWDIVEGDAYATIESSGNVCTVTVIAEPDSGSVTVTISCTIGNFTRTQNITVINSNSVVEPVESIEFAATSYEINISESTSGQVNAHVNANATNQGVTYSTEDSAITVDPDTGVVTASALGTFTVKATAVDNAEKYATVNVLVYASEMIVYGGTNGWATTGNTKFVADTKDDDSADNSVWTTTVTTDSDSVYKFVIELGVNGSAIDWNAEFNLTQVNTTNDLSTDSNAGINTSNNPPCYTIKGVGNMHHITVDLSGKQPKIIIENLGIAVSSVVINADDSTIAPGASTTLTAVVKPDNATYTDSDITWSVTSGTGTLSATTGASVTLTAGSEEETVTVTCAVKGVSVSKEIKVSASNTPVTSIEFVSSTLTLDMSSKTTDALPSITISPSNATNQNVTYTSSSDKLTVDGDGNITALGIGTFTVTVSADGGTDVTATCTVTVWSSKWQIYGGTGDWTYVDATVPTLSADNNTITFTYKYTSGWNWYKFAIIYDVKGAETDSDKWEHHFGNDNTNLPSDASSSYFGISGNDWYMTVGGSESCDYTLTVKIDISGDSPTVSSMVMTANANT